jgi:hypothetical protein
VVRVELSEDESDIMVCGIIFVSYLSDVDEQPSAFGSAAILIGVPHQDSISVNAS